jgi:hypothetical protein
MIDCWHDYSPLSGGDIYFLFLLLVVIPRVVALCADYYVIIAIIVFCCLSDDNTYLVYIVGDTTVLGGEVRCCVSAEILTEIWVIDCFS